MNAYIPPNSGGTYVPHAVLPVPTYYLPPTTYRLGPPASGAIYNRAHPIRTAKAAEFQTAETQRYRLPATMDVTDECWYNLHQSRPVYNQHIITAPVALFLGAGASRPFGKMLMGEFIDYLERQEAFQTDGLFQDIVGAPGGRDLEHLFEELEEWSRKVYCTFDGSGFVRKRGIPAVSPEPPLKRLAASAARLQENLRREVFAAFRDFAPAQGKDLVERFGALFEPLLQKLDLKKNPLVVFTTNYDPAIETFCQALQGEYRLCDGFVSQWNAGSPTWSRGAIDQLELGATNQKDVVLFKLHGSTGWFRTEAKLIKSDAPIYAGEDPRFRNVLIYPAKKKVALEEPYFTGYDYFQRTIENCKFCLVIGYSFRDYDALSRLRSAASFNPGLRLMVLDPCASQICKGLGEQGIEAESLPSVFGNSQYEQNYLTAIKSALSAPATRALAQGTASGA